MLTWERCNELAEQNGAQGKWSDAESMWIAALSHLESDDPNDDRFIVTYCRLADACWSQRKFAESENYYKRCVSMSESHNGPMSMQTAAYLASLAGAYYNQHKYAEAEPLCMRFLEICEGCLGATHDQVGLAVAGLATIYHARQKFDKAEEMYQRAIGIRTRAQGGTHPEVIALITKYANLLSLSHREDEAQHLRECAKKFQTGEWVPQAPDLSEPG
ncbi:MAG TPA: tetratricopeptide repeat protein [Planktothrix sp.]|jgi:tetratricopeptide (TPR) repeat protein